jgi:hypothetical protein
MSILLFCDIFWKTLKNRLHNLPFKSVLGMGLGVTIREFADFKGFPAFIGIKNNPAAPVFSAVDFVFEHKKTPGISPRGLL